MMRKVLIANRGEIALRILRACKELGLQTVAVHSDIDSDAMHVRLADESVCIGPADPRKSYLNIPNIMSAAEITGADSIHPGFGFLSENHIFASIVVQHGITFIGPSSEHISLMGNKVAARESMKSLGIPVIPGGSATSVKEAKEIAALIGFPVMIKAASGGGGKGMRRADNMRDIEESWGLLQKECELSFGSGELYIEKFLTHPRHIEVQIFGDGENIVHIGIRDCSVQRSHQKILEECPSPGLSEAEAQNLANMSVKALKVLGYKSLGTVEYLWQDGEAFFIEMNTRIQVEHAITEMVYRIDLVKEQIKVAAGGKLPWKQSDIIRNGHSIEYRINAEDPYSWIPSSGKITQYLPPGGLGVRVDSGLYLGVNVTPHYDSMICKLIAYGKDREECIAKLKRCMGEFVIDGVKTTLPLLKNILEFHEIISGDYNNRVMEKIIESHNKEK